ncbi:MAG: NAD(P)-dependent oxidoreductase [Candidatus Heimdallarchaeota archaeon]|nr:NAD(P)-dependent oxidoreductase [Candidatus Heimdallarchaeota archaeon]
MKILITGAFGLIGSNLLNHLKFLTTDEILCADLKNKRTKKVARKYKKRFPIKWGDLADIYYVEEILKDIDLIIHLAFHLPPINEKNLLRSERTNLLGTRYIIEIAKKQQKPPRIIFASSVSIYGDTRDKPQPLPIDTEFNPVDKYAKDKVECMKMIEESGLEYSFFIIASVVSVDTLTTDPKMFEVPLDTPLELIHPIDVGEAFYNAISSDKIWKKLLHIGGGKYCRVNYKEYLDLSMKQMGLGSLPEEAFGGNLYHASYISSEESNEILDYQKHTNFDILVDIEMNNKFVIKVVKLLSPIVRRYLLKQSPYYKLHSKK